MPDITRQACGVFAANANRQVGAERRRRDCCKSARAARERKAGSRKHLQKRSLHRVGRRDVVADGGQDHVEVLAQGQEHGVARALCCCACLDEGCVRVCRGVV
jgi:hypothetical protein